MPDPTTELAIIDRDIEHTEDYLAALRKRRAEIVAGQTLPLIEEPTN